MLGLAPYSKSPETLTVKDTGFELLGLKWLASLRLQHAKELTPVEVGDHGWKTSIHNLTSGRTY